MTGQKPKFTLITRLNGKSSTRRQSRHATREAAAAAADRRLKANPPSRLVVWIYDPDNRLVAHTSDWAEKNQDTAPRHEVEVGMGGFTHSDPPCAPVTAANHYPVAVTVWSADEVGR